MTWQPIESVDVLEMPSTITAMRATNDGRLLVTLEDGRVVDVAPWFAQPLPAPPQESE